MKFDTLIQNARVFNNGEPPVTEDIAILDGKIVKRGHKLPSAEAGRVIDATGLWAMPGLFDIHTHYDLELEVAPGLPESTRHGTTTVVISNCSLGLAYGNQREGAIDPIVDCYARVENMPKSVLRACADKIDWSTPEGYLEHLDALNLGPNVVTMIPHSMLRIEAMGFEASVTRDPTSDEVEQMRTSLRAGLRAGYVGFSTDALPFHYLANQPNCHKTIPTQFAKYDEIKQLTQVVREEDGIWQATPPKDRPLEVFKTFLLSSGRLHGKPLRTTVVAALDVAANRNLIKLTRILNGIINSKFFRGDFYMQALGARFKIWSDGAVTPIAEEIPELRALNETDLEDRAARQKILTDPDYIKLFRAMWMKGKTGFGLARIKRLLRVEDYAFDRDMAGMTVDLCPLKEWEGKTFQALFERVLNANRGTATDVTEAEQLIISRDFFWVSDEADFMLQILRTFDTELSWYTVTANRDIRTVRKLLMDPALLPGFNDSGAHLTNMAFYDVNLRSLKLAAEGGEADANYMVKRLTKDAADVFGVARGTIYQGDIADLILVDPKQLAMYDGEAHVQRIYRDEFQHPQLVNRSDQVVPLVLINGQVAWQNDAFSSELGRRKMGSLLKPTHLQESQAQVAAAAVAA
ncbi:N-acyl-D-amino-acid deacylase family protein [Arenicella xantha]|uniref:N-acyl-D-aspartate/D-glutamate deacylase n=1 Tax=Arenicella xantha TaxID=644221 RepID=A0A395JME7_9GAMM|nr:amidohydrolase family protein [Arenicella xantha]RBP49084.1 N-acyl-D-aspartate/D-glutamate deacylase [Arenicella xantha]